MERIEHPNEHMPRKETEQKFANVSQELAELTARGKQDPINPKTLSFELKNHSFLVE